MFAQNIGIEENEVIKVSPPDLFVKTSKDELRLDTFDFPDAKGTPITSL